MAAPPRDPRGPAEGTPATATHLSLPFGRNPARTSGMPRNPRGCRGAGRTPQSSGRRQSGLPTLPGRSRPAGRRPFPRRPARPSAALSGPQRPGRTHHSPGPTLPRLPWRRRTRRAAAQPQRSLSAASALRLPCARRTRTQVREGRGKGGEGWLIKTAMIKMCAGFAFIL